MLLLMLIWNEHADEPGSERYLLLIAYIAGLSGGLHLMSVLTIVIVGIWVVLRKYTETIRNVCNRFMFLSVTLSFSLL